MPYASSGSQFCPTSNSPLFIANFSSARTPLILLQAALTVHPGVACLIDIGAVKPGSRIQICEARAAYDTSGLRQRLGILVTQLKLLQSEEDATAIRSALASATALPWVPDADRGDRPIFTGRSMHVNNLSDDLVVCSDRWKVIQRPIQQARLVLKAVGVWGGLRAAPGKGADAFVEGPFQVDDGSAPFHQLNYPESMPTIKDVLFSQSQAILQNRVRARRDGAAAGYRMPDAALDPEDGQHMYDDGGAGAGAGASSSSSAAAASSASVVPKQCPLIGRISSIGRVLHYGTTNDATRFPFKFEFQIKDESRVVNVVCWQGAAARWYDSIVDAGLGALVAIHKYRVKKHGDKTEVSVNAEGPEGVIYRVGYPSERQATKQFPSARFEPIAPQLRFNTTAHIMTLPAGAITACAGVISRVSGLFRTPVYDEDQRRAVLSAANSDISIDEVRRVGNIASAGVGAAAADAGVAFGAVAAGNGGAGAGGLYGGQGSGAGAASSSSAASSSGAGAGSSSAASSSAAIPQRPVSQAALRSSLFSSGQLGLGLERSIWFVYRWVVIRDGASNREIAVKLYSNSWPDILKAPSEGGLKAGDMIAITFLRVIAPPLPSFDTMDDEGRVVPMGELEKLDAVADRPLYLTSTEYTLPIHASAAKYHESQKLAYYARHVPSLQELFAWYAQQAFAVSLAPSSPLVMSLKPSHLPAQQYTPSTVRPRSLQEYVDMMIRGGGGPCSSNIDIGFASASNGNDDITAITSSNGFRAPILRPSEVAALCSGRVEAISAILRANARSNLGVRDPTLRDQMAIDDDNTALVTSPLPLARAHVALQKYQAVRVIVTGHVASLVEVVDPPAPAPVAPEAGKTKRSRGRPRGATGAKTASAAASSAAAAPTSSSSSSLSAAGPAALEKSVIASRTRARSAQPAVLTSKRRAKSAGAAGGARRQAAKRVARESGASTVAAASSSSGVGPGHVSRMDDAATAEVHPEDDDRATQEFESDEEDAVVNEEAGGAGGARRKRSDAASVTSAGAAAGGGVMTRSSRASAAGTAPFAAATDAGAASSSSQQTATARAALTDGPTSNRRSSKGSARLAAAGITSRGRMPTRSSMSAAGASAGAGAAATRSAERTRGKPSSAALWSATNAAGLSLAPSRPRRSSSQPPASRPAPRRSAAPAASSAAEPAGKATRDDAASRQKQAKALAAANAAKAAKQARHNRRRSSSADDAETASAAGTVVVAPAAPAQQQHAPPLQPIYPSPVEVPAPVLAAATDVPINQLDTDLGETLSSQIQTAAQVDAAAAAPAAGAAAAAVVPAAPSRQHLDPYDDCGEKVATASAAEIIIQRKKQAIADRSNRLAVLTAEWKQACKAAKKAKTPAAKPPKPAELLALEAELAAEQADPDGYARKFAADIPTGLYCMTVAGRAPAHTDTLRVVLHPSALLPQNPHATPPQLQPADQDASLAAIRRFFPPSAPQDSIEGLANYCLAPEPKRKTFAFCLLVTDRGDDDGDGAGPQSAGAAAASSSAAAVGGAGAGASAAASSSVPQKPAAASDAMVEDDEDPPAMSGDEAEDEDPTPSVGAGAGSGTAAGAAAGGRQKKSKPSKQQPQQAASSSASAPSADHQPQPQPQPAYPETKVRGVRKAIVRMEAIYEMQDDGSWI